MENELKNWLKDHGWVAFEADAYGTIAYEKNSVVVYTDEDIAKTEFVASASYAPDSLKGMHMTYAVAFWESGDDIEDVVADIKAQTRKYVAWKESKKTKAPRDAEIIKWGKRILEAFE